MKWDINELNSRLLRLTTLLSEEQDSSIRATLQSDIYCLKQLINYISKEKVYDISDNAPFLSGICSKAKVDETFEFLKSNQFSIGNYLLELSAKHIVSPTVHNKRINPEECDDLVKDFFLNYDSDILDTYNQLYKGNRVELNSKRFFDVNAIGLTHHICYDGISYINCNFNGRIKSTQILPHEVIHAHQNTGVTDFKLFVDKTYSYFRETYSVLIEFLYAEYLKNTKYQKLGNYFILNKLDELCCLVEYYYEDYMNIDKSTCKNGIITMPNGKVSNEEKYRLLTSNALAIYLYSIYFQDKIKGKEIIDNFNRDIGVISDEDMIKKYCGNDMNSSINYIISRQLTRR